MKSSQIVFTAPGVAELVQTEIPAPAAGQVQVRIAVSAVSSGTERANLLGSDTLSWVVPKCEAVFPRVLGYSSAGVIEQVGEGVTEFAVGDRVALSWSTHTHLQNIAAANVTPIGEIPFEEAALFHIATFPLAALRKCKLELGESAIVMGMGILGLTAIKLLRAAGAAPSAAGRGSSPRPCRTCPPCAFRTAGRVPAGAGVRRRLPAPECARARE